MMFLTSISLSFSLPVSVKSVKISLGEIFIFKKPAVLALGWVV